MLLPGVQARRDFTSAVIYKPLYGKTYFCHMRLVLVTKHLTHAILKLSEYKLSETLNKVSSCIRLQSPKCVSPTRVVNSKLDKELYFKS